MIYDNSLLKIDKEIRKRDTYLESFVAEPFTNYQLQRNSSKKSNLDPSVFRRSPHESMWRYRIDDLSSFAVLGFDVKITPTGEVKIIEVNGINSGMKGFKDAGVEYDGKHNPTVEELRERFPFQLDNQELWRYIKAGLDSRNSCDEALREHIGSLGEAPIDYIAARLAIAGKSFHRMGGIEAIAEASTAQDLSNFYNLITPMNWTPSLIDGIHPMWDVEYGEKAETLIRIEKMLEDKSKTDRLFEGNRDIKPRSYEYTKEGFQRLVREEKPKYVVIKPSNGSRGEGLHVIEADALPENRLAYSTSMIAEAFVPSKPILSSQDGDYHDGCMRYMVFVEEDKNGNVKLYHFGGYWRLSPKPITDSIDIDAIRANLALGAMPEKVSTEDLTLVRESLERAVPIFYKNLTEVANPTKALKWLEREYHKLEK